MSLYNEALEYYNSLDKRGMKFGLDRIRLLLSYIDNPDRSLKIVHFAGTNGKGSIIAFVSSILSGAGYKAGAFTTPPLIKVNETIRIGNVNISDDDFTRIILNIRDFIESNIELLEAELTSFEVLTVAAMQYFKEMNCDLVLLETGLGGTTDATNVIGPPLISVITKIAYDHMGLLGNDIKSIAAEKAGIIKADTDVVMALQEFPEAAGVISERCRIMNSRLIKVSKEDVRIISQELGHPMVFNYKQLNGIEIGLNGVHQVYNASVAIEIIFALDKHGFIVKAEDILNGLKDTRWPCRIEVVKKNPLIIIDAAHNADGAEALTDYLKAITAEDKKVTFIFGVLKDKNYTEMIEKIIPLACNILTVTPHSHRALDAADLAEIIRGYGINAVACGNIREAINASLDGSEIHGTEKATQDSVICIFGSFFYVGEAKDILSKM